MGLAGLGGQAGRRSSANWGPRSRRNPAVDLARCLCVYTQPSVVGGDYSGPRHYRDSSRGLRTPKPDWQIAFTHFKPVG
jgi:hypothetical protein